MDWVQEQDFEHVQAAENVVVRPLKKNIARQMIVRRGLIGQAGVIALLPVMVGGKFELVNVKMERKVIVQDPQLMSKCVTISDVGKGCSTITVGKQIREAVTLVKSGQKSV